MAFRLPQGMVFTSAQEIELSLSLVRATAQKGHILCALLTAAFELSDESDGFSLWTKNKLWSLAEHIDAWHGHPYHNSYHHADVLLIALALSAPLTRRPAINGLEGGDLRALIATAAVFHDMDYDPERTEPFANERASLTALGKAYGNLWSVCAPQLQTLILSTAPCIRPSMGNGYDAWFRRMKASNTDLTLDLSPALYTASCILSDADIAASVGLSERWMAARADALAWEMGYGSMPPEITEAFFSKVVGPLFLTPLAGQMFGENLKANRNEAVAQAFILKQCILDS